VAADVKTPEKLTSPVVPPVRLTVKTKSVVPEFPSFCETESVPAENSTDCVSDAEVVKLSVVAPDTPAKSLPAMSLMTPEAIST
jgi:hypothetical protein